MQLSLHALRVMVSAARNTNVPVLHWGHAPIMVANGTTGEVIEFEMERSRIVKKENEWSSVVGMIIRDKEGGTTHFRRRTATRSSKI